MPKRPVCVHSNALCSFKRQQKCYDRQVSTFACTLKRLIAVCVHIDPRDQRSAYALKVPPFTGQCKLLRHVEW